MNKKFYGTLLLGTLLLGSTIVSCKDYDDDIDNLQNQITQLATKADMQSEVSKLQSAVATAQAAAENKAAAAEQAAKDAAAKAQAAADAAAKAQGSADAAATVEALEKVAAEAAAAAKAAEEAKVAAETKAEELASQLAELQALAATLVSTEDFEAAKKDLNDKYAELAAKIGETTGVTGMTGINLVGTNNIKSGYGVWAGVRENMQAVEWDGPKAETVNAIEKGTKLAAWGVKDFSFSVNPTDFDASKIEAFAIVNQFDEVAPIAFGTPKAVTRAAAGAWTLPVLGNVIYGEKAADFQKNFSKDPKKGNGTMATLAAGQFAGALGDEFCTVVANENKDKATFTTIVKYDDIDGVTELNVTGPEYVFDAYIVQIAEGMEGSVAHDSIVYKLAYTGTTLTYDAAAVKKLVDKNGDKTLKVTVKQINLNGYIHTSTETIKFSKKPAAENIKAETVLVSGADHQVVINVLNTSTGKKTDLQKQSVDLSEALTDWGIDLAKKDAESTIHWMHTTLGAEKVETVYYYETDETKTDINKDLIKKFELKKDGTTGQISVDFEFVADYKYTGWNSGDKKDVAWNGKKIFVELSFTGTDTDATESTSTDYKVIVPIKFKKIDATQYYNWNKASLSPSANKIVKDFGTTAPSAGVILTVQDHFAAVAGSGVALVTKDTTHLFDTDGTTLRRLAPGAYLTGGTNSAFYASEQARINALDETLAPTGNVYVTSASGKADDKFKADNINALDKFYNNNVSIQQSGSLYNQTSYAWNATNKAYDSERYLAYYGSSLVDATTSNVPNTYRTDNVNIYWHGWATVSDANMSFLNNTYTVNGLQVKIADRYVDAPLSVEFKYTSTTSATATLVTSAKLANTANASILLSNSEFAPVSASNFDGTFTLMTAAGKKLEIAGALDFTPSAGNATINTAPLNSDGSIPASASIAGTAISAASVNYNYGSATGANTYALQFTMNTPVTAGAEKKLAVKLTIKENALRLSGLTSALGSGTHEFIFVIELQ